MSTAEVQAEAGPKSPDEMLAEEIVDALIEAELIDPSKRQHATTKVAAGTMRQDDWRALIELRRPPAREAANG